MSAISFTTPSSAAVATQSNWLTSLAVFNAVTAPALNAVKPSIDTMETRSWGSQDITGLFEVLKGGKNYVENNNGFHFEEDRLNTIINATGTTAGALAAVTYTIVAADTITSFPPVNLPYIATGTVGFPSLGGPTLVPVRVHEELVFPGDIRGKVTAVSTNTFTCTPTGSVDLPTTIATDEIYSNGLSTPEGFEGQIDSNNWREHVVYWNSEIMTEAHKTTGTAMTQALWFIQDNADGSKGYTWWFKGQKNAFKQFRNKREQRWVNGNSVTNATTLPVNYSAQYQQVNGLIPFAQSFGNNFTYDLITGQTQADFETIIIDSLNKNAGSTENCLYESIAYKSVMQSWLRVEMQNGGIQYNALGGKDAYVSLDFDSFKLLNYTFHNKVYSMFSDPTTLGSVSAVYKNFAFGVPMESNMYQCVEKKEKVDVPPMRINYLKLGTTSREWIETVTGGAIPNYTNNFDTATITFRSENSPEFFGANRWFTITGKNL